MSQEIDRYTFQLAELKGEAYYSAFGKVTKDFLHAYRGNKHYDTILSAFLQRLFLEPENIDQENLKHLENDFVTRVNAMLAEERAQDKERLLKGRKPVYELQQEEEGEEEEEEEPTLTEEELRRLEEARLQRELQEQERLAAREEERRRNEEFLRSRARQVDAKAMEKILQEAVLLNPGQLNLKSGGKHQQQQQQQNTADSLREMESQVMHLMKEKERLQFVLHTSEDELPAKLTEAKEQLALVETKVSTQTSSGQTSAIKPAMQQKQMNARIAELKQKITKLTTERNRLALQLKAQPHPLHEEILSVMQQRDEAQIKIDQS